MRKDLLFRMRALAAKAPLLRRMRTLTPFTVAPQARTPERLLVRGRCEIDANGSLTAVGRRGADGTYTLPLHLTGEGGEVIDLPLPLAQPLAAIEGFAYDELDVTQGRVYYRTHTVTLTDVSESIVLYGSLNGRKVYRLPLAIPARAEPLACISDGLTPYPVTGTLGKEDYACAIALSGAALIFTLGPEINTLEAVREAVRSLSLHIVYARADEDVQTVDTVVPTLPSPSCRVSVTEGAQADVELVFFPHGKEA